MKFFGISKEGSKDAEKRMDAKFKIELEVQVHRF